MQGSVVGPYTISQLKDQVAAGFLNPENEIWSGQSGLRQRVVDIPALFKTENNREMHQSGPMNSVEVIVQQYYLSVSTVGPFTTEEVQACVPPSWTEMTSVCPEGETAWRPLSEFPNLDISCGILVPYIWSIVGAVVSTAAFFVRVTAVEQVWPFWEGLTAVVSGGLAGFVIGLLVGGLANRIMNLGDPTREWPLTPRLWEGVAAAMAGAGTGFFVGGPFDIGRVCWAIAGGVTGFVLGRNHLKMACAKELRGWIALLSL